MKKIKKVNIIISIILIVLTCIAIYSYSSSQEKKNIMSYNTFISNVNSGRITDVYLSENETIKVLSSDKKTYFVSNPRYENFKEYLLTKGVNVHEADNNLLNNVIPSIFSLIMISFFLFYIYKSSKSRQSSFKLSAIDAKEESKGDIQFENIAGNTEAKENIKELVDFIKNPEKYEKYNARIPRGIILYGPPGTGKTLLAKALASECNVPFYAVSGSDFVQVYVGVGAGRIRDLFKKAKEKGKAVIFIDEIDAIGKKRNSYSDGGGSDERDQTLNALLSEMSGFKSNTGIIVMAATNRLDVLDEALLRPGRFDRHIEVSLPDVNARLAILKLYTKNKPLSNDVNLLTLAKQTVYFSGAKLENLVNEAAIYAVRNNSEFITMEHLDLAYSSVIAGEEKKDRSFITEHDKEITAYHEAGHALVSKLIQPENIIRKITIIPSTKGAGGYTLSIPQDNIYHTKKQLINNIKVALAGRCAEELVFGKDNITTGASNDIKNATNTIISMAASYGMFENTGLLDYEYLSQNRLINDSKLVDFCKDIVNGLYNDVITLLKNNLNKLDKLSSALLENETLYEEKIDLYINNSL